MSCGYAVSMLGRVTRLCEFSGVLVGASEEAEEYGRG